MKQRFPKWIALLCALALMAACATPTPTQEPTPPEPTPEPIVVTDLGGREVAFPVAAARMVSLTASGTEMLDTLGLIGCLVGVDEDSSSLAANVPTVGTSGEPSVADILALAPDVVLADADLPTEALAALTQANVSVLSLECTSLEDIMTAIFLIGVVCGREDEANNLIYEKTADRYILEAVVEDVTPKSVYLAMGFGEGGNRSAGPGTYLDELLTAANATNIMTALPDCPAWPQQFPTAFILEQDPDVIVVSSLNGTAEAFCAQAEFQDLRAVKTGQVFTVDIKTLRLGLNVYTGLEHLIAAIHPDAALPTPEEPAFVSDDASHP